VSAWVIHVGFTHVSDDDYARVTIAQSFAHAPSLDPSGTSWLPFPFWLNGAAMALFGRTLVVARGVAVACGVLGTVVYHRALIALGMRAWLAWIAVALATSAPWSAWLGVATVPEALTAALTAAAAASICHARMRVLGSLALLVACLSRYEAWPVAATFSAACIVAAITSTRRDSAGSRVQNVAAAVIALLGPAAWLVWNARSHGDALHFVARVAAYRLHVSKTTGEGRSWLLYPDAFVRAGPGALTLMSIGLPALAFDRELRRRWAAPAVAAVALAVLLVEGGLHDGAPTHHPERALVALFWLGTAFGVDGMRSLALRFIWGRAEREAGAIGIVTVIGVAWALAWPERLRDYPARSSSEDRSSEIARGEDMRAREVEHVTITPCAYEHFALIAAFGAPERVTVVPRTSTGSPCPMVHEY